MTNEEIVGRCGVCNRATWDMPMLGNPCGILQPNGSRCPGYFQALEHRPENQHLPERLRLYATGPYAWLNQAADEIERLGRELNRVTRGDVSNVITTLGDALTEIGRLTRERDRVTDSYLAQIERLTRERDEALRGCSDWGAKEYTARLQAERLRAALLNLSVAHGGSQCICAAHEDARAAVSAAEQRKDDK